MDDDQMTDDEQLEHSQGLCLKALKDSIDAFIGKSKHKKPAKSKKKVVPALSLEQKKEMVFNYANKDILRGVIVPSNFKNTKN